MRKIVRSLLVLSVRGSLYRLSLLARKFSAKTKGEGLAGETRLAGAYFKSKMYYRSPNGAKLYSALSMGTLSRQYGDIHGNTLRMENSVHDKERCIECGLWKRKLTHCRHCMTRPNREQAHVAGMKAFRAPPTPPMRPVSAGSAHARVPDNQRPSMQQNIGALELTLKRMQAETKNRERELFTAAYLEHTAAKRDQAWERADTRHQVDEARRAGHYAAAATAVATSAAAQAASTEMRMNDMRAAATTADRLLEDRTPSPPDSTRTRAAFSTPASTDRAYTAAAKLSLAKEIRAETAAMRADRLMLHSDDEEAPSWRDVTNSELHGVYKHMPNIAPIPIPPHLVPNSTQGLSVAIAEAMQVASMLQREGRANDAMAIIKLIVAAQQGPDGVRR